MNMQEELELQNRYNKDINSYVERFESKIPDGALDHLYEKIKFMMELEGVYSIFFQNILMTIEETTSMSKRVADKNNAKHRLSKQIDDDIKAVHQLLHSFTPSTHFIFDNEERLTPTSSTFVDSLRMLKLELEEAKKLTKKDKQQIKKINREDFKILNNDYFKDITRYKQTVTVDGLHQKLNTYFKENGINSHSKDIEALINFIKKQ